MGDIILHSYGKEENLCQVVPDYILSIGIIDSILWYNKLVFLYIESISTYLDYTMSVRVMIYKLLIN